MPLGLLLITRHSVLSHVLGDEQIHAVAKPLISTALDIQDPTPVVLPPPLSSVSITKCRVAHRLVSSGNTKQGSVKLYGRLSGCFGGHGESASLDLFFELIDWPEGIGKFCVVICVIRTHRSFVGRLRWRSRSPWHYRPMQPRRVFWRLLWQRHRMQPRYLRRRLRMQLMRPANQASPVLSRITALTLATPNSTRMTTVMMRL